VTPLQSPPHQHGTPRSASRRTSRTCRGSSHAASAPLSTGTPSGDSFYRCGCPYRTRPASHRGIVQSERALHVIRLEADTGSGKTQPGSGRIRTTRRVRRGGRTSDLARPSDCTRTTGRRVPRDHHRQASGACAYIYPPLFPFSSAGASKVCFGQIPLRIVLPSIGLRSACISSSNSACLASSNSCV